MELFKKLLLLETENTSQKEVDYTISVINKVYNEWKKQKRRINAVDIVTTSVNKLANINPALMDQVHKAAKLKATILIMRCLDNPIWKPVEAKEKIYKRLYPLINVLQNEKPNSGTEGSLRDIIMTRLSASIAYQEHEGQLFIAYEPKLPTSYMQHLFGSRTAPVKTYRMSSLSLPEDFDSLIEILKINYEKALKKFQTKENGEPCGTRTQHTQLERLLILPKI